MKYVLVPLILLFLAACEGPNKSYCEVSYDIYYREKSTNKCIKSKESILQFYNSDTIKIFQFKEIGIEEKSIRYDFNLDSCLYLKTSVFSPTTTFTIGNSIGKHDTLSFERNKDDVKYYLNGKFQYEVKDACRKNSIVECIIEI